MKRLKELLQADYTLTAAPYSRQMSFQSVACPFIALLSAEWFRDSPYVRAHRRIYEEVFFEFSFLRSAIRLAGQLCETRVGIFFMYVLR